MPQIIEVPGHGQVEFPDGMSDDQIVTAIKVNSTQPRRVNQAALNPEANVLGMTVNGETSGGFNPAAAIIKAGGVLTSLNRGMEQAKWGPGDWLREKLGMQSTGISDALKQANDSEKPAMQDLQEVHPGSAVIGDMATAVGMPWRALPAIAAMEYGSPTERATRGLVTAAGGKIAQEGGKIASRLFSQSTEKAATSAAQNSVRDQAVAEAQGLGYKTVPSVSGGSMLGQIVEGATGKIKASQLASVKNQDLTDNLIRQGFGLPAEAPIAKETMRAVRQEAATAGYDPVRQVPRMDTDAEFRTAAANLTSRSDNASKDFGELVKSDVQPLAQSLSQVKSFTGDTAVDAISVLREKASDAYSKGDKTLGKAYRGAAETIEAQVERSLANQGKDGAAVLQAFRDARTKMAQTFDVEKAIREGQGKVDASVLGRLYNKNPGRMSGTVGQVGRIAAAMPEVMRVPKDGWSTPVTALDSTASMMASIIAGHPGPMAIPAARVAGRYGMLSDMGQSLLTKPKYKPSTSLGVLSGLLDNRAAPYAAGLLGYQAGR